MRSLEDILQESALRHRHLCPRQVLGARMALYAAELLGLELPRDDKRLLVTAETDGCTVDGLIAATHCRAGSRTLRILDFGKVAATFTDTKSGTSLRVVPQHRIRSVSQDYAPTAKNKWEAMLAGYKIMPMSELFDVQAVQLKDPLSQIISGAGRKAVCDDCGEEIINGREVMKDEIILCRACAGDGYYQFQLATGLFQLSGRSW